jgi:pimeloyl-ACP methyl ester carboxylesterase
MTIGHVIYGQGPVRAVVLHGWFGDGRVFETMLPALDPDVFSLAFMDYRGYGASRHLPGPFNVDTIALDAEALVTQLGWQQFAVVGHSMGGKAALRLAANLGSRVTRILALTPVWAGAAPFDAQTLSLFRGAARDVNLRMTILNHSTGGRLPSVWLRAMAAQSIKASTMEAFAAYFESWALEDFAAEVHSLPQSTLVVAGAEDGGIPVQAVTATWMATLPNARLQVLAGCGHYPMLESPLALAAIFERFLRPHDAT